MSNKRRLETIRSMLETETMMDEEGKTYFLEVLDFYEKVVVGEREGVAKEIQKEVVSCFNGVQIASGTVSAGSNKSLALSYEDGTGGVTVVLTASSFNIDTFSGWTKDGTIVDRWSNPATIKAEASCTLSCAFGSTGGTSTGAILCDRYGAILYGDAGAANTSATIAISATYRDSGHTITWAIRKVGESEGAKSASVTTALSVSKTLAWESGGSGSNMPLYADKKIAVLPKLFRVRFNCQEAEHVYDVTIKKNGATIYSETYLSGTFSRTFEL